MYPWHSSAFEIMQFLSVVPFFRFGLYMKEMHCFRFSWSFSHILQRFCLLYFRSGEIFLTVLLSTVSSICIWKCKSFLMRWMLIIQCFLTSDVFCKIMWTINWLGVMLLLCMQIRSSTFSSKYTSRCVCCTSDKWTMISNK